MSNYNGYTNEDTYRAAVLLTNNAEYYYFLIESDNNSEFDDETLIGRMSTVLASISLDEQYDNIDIYKVNRDEIEQLFLSLVVVDK